MGKFTAWIENPNWDTRAAVCSFKKTKYGTPVYELRFPDEPDFDPVIFSSPDELRTELSMFRPELIYVQVEMETAG
jgi:hypothetical protein